MSKVTITEELETDLHGIERKLHDQGFVRVAGLDEAGRGPLAGPVCAAAVIFEPGVTIPGVNDSKQLTPEEREELYEEIVARALTWGVAFACAEEIDTINILQATKLACRRALRQLKVLPDYLVLDALRLERFTTPQQSLIKGDARCFSIAAASIIAKVTRDRIMCQYASEYPDYGFEQHKGYGTPFHRAALNKLGPSSLHRSTFLEAWFSSSDPVWSKQFQAFKKCFEECMSREDLKDAQRRLGKTSAFLPRCEIKRLQTCLSEACSRLNLS